MAIDDSNSPKNIPDSGQVSPGNTNSDRSINLLKNIKTVTPRNQSNTSVNQLRNWFRTYIGSGGDFNNTGGNQKQVNLSDWHGVGILGIGIVVTNETHSKYGTNNDAKIRIRGYFSEKYKYTFKLGTQSKTATHGNDVTFTGLQGGDDNAVGKEYTIDVIALKPNNQSIAALSQALPTSKVIVRTAYNGTAQVKGVNTTGINSFGTSDNPINFTYTSGTGPGKESNPLWLLIGKEDTGAGGRDYGTSFSYP